MSRFHNDPPEVVSWMDRATATDYATFAPMVLRHADLGDAAARRIVQSAAESVDGLVRALLVAGAPRIALLGGLSRSSFHETASVASVAEMDDTKRHQQSRHGPTGSTKRLHMIRTLETLN